MPWNIDYIVYIAILLLSSFNYLFASNILLLTRIFYREYTSFFNASHAYTIIITVHYGIY